MSDYIKREDALDIVADNNVTGEITLNRYDKIIDGIYDIPSANVAPVRHGRWIDDGNKTVCSLCHGSVSFSLIDGKWTYGLHCQTCGAKMG